MIVNTSSLREIYSSFNTVFNKAYEETTVLYPKIAMEVPSEANDENYAWLGAMPSMREWVGSREIRNLTAHTYTIKNKLFEKTVSVSRNDIEDDRIGVYKPMIQDLAESSRKHPDKLVFGLLPRGFVEHGYDGVPFISDAHPYLYAQKDEKQSNKGTDKLTPTSYGAARASMMSLVDDEGEPLYIVPDLLVVSPQNEAAARRIVYAEEINHETNIYKGTAEVLVAPELVRNPDMWFLLCTAKVIKPFIFQNRRKPALVAKTSPSDDNVFFDNEYIYGADMRCNAGFGLWQLAYGSDGSTGEG